MTKFALLVLLRVILFTVVGTVWLLLKTSILITLLPCIVFAWLCKLTYDIGAEKQTSRWVFGNSQTLT